MLSEPNPSLLTRVPKIRCLVNKLAQRALGIWGDQGSDRTERDTRSTPPLLTAGIGGATIAPEYDIGPAIRVFVSYTHDTPAHKERVLALSTRFRRDGLDAWLDQYEPAPPEGWPRWMQQQIELTDFILVICTPTYRRRFEGKEDSGRGKGAIWEGLFTMQLLYEAQAQNRHIVPVLFDDEAQDVIPLALRPYTYYRVPDGYTVLYRRLTGQPDIVPPPVGRVRKLHPRNHG